MWLNKVTPSIILDEIGNLCVPSDPEAKAILFDKSDISSRYAFFKDITSILICGGIALGLSLLYLILVQNIPKKMNYIAIAAGISILVVASFWILFK